MEVLIRKSDVLKSLMQYVEGKKTIGQCIDECEVIKPKIDNDAISRQAVLNTLDNMDKTLDEDRTVENYKELLKECYKVLLPVTPQPKIEHWIMTNDYFTGAYGNIDYVKCSCCGEDSLEEGNYCPNCGAKMEG